MSAPKLHLLCGLPASGKTTRAEELEAGGEGIRLTADEWVWQLFPDDPASAARDHRKGLVEQVQWELAERLLGSGVSVILDWGLWTRAEREHYLRLGRDLGADVHIVHLDVPLETLRERLAEREVHAEPGVFRISAEELETWASQFEAPTPDETAGDVRDPSGHGSAG